MRRISGLVAAMAGIALMSCADKDPVSSLTQDEPIPAAKLTVSNAVTSSCDGPDCRPGFGGPFVQPMDDRVAEEKFTPAAGGTVITDRVQFGRIAISSVEVANLPPGREFELVVVVAPEGVLEFANDVVVESGPILIGDNGLLSVTDFPVGDFLPGTYRVDIVVFPPGDEFPRDFISACNPFPIVTVK